MKDYPSGVPRGTANDWLWEKGIKFYQQNRLLNRLELQLQLIGKL